MKLRQQGFGTIELIIGVIVLALLVAGGFSVFNQDDDTEPANNQNNVTQPQTDVDQVPGNDSNPGTPVPTAIDTTGWTQVDNEIYSVRIPDGWSVSLSDRDTIIYTYEVDGTNYTAGTAAEVRQETQQGTDVSPVIEMALWGGTEPNFCEEGLTKPEQDVEAVIGQGVSVDLCARSTGSSYYVTRNAGNGVLVGHSSEIGSDTEVIEAMLSTIEFK